MTSNNFLIVDGENFDVYTARFSRRSYKGEAGLYLEILCLENNRIDPDHPFYDHYLQFDINLPEGEALYGNDAVQFSYVDGVNSGGLSVYFGEHALVVAMAGQIKFSENGCTLYTKGLIDYYPRPLEFRIECSIREDNGELANGLDRGKIPK